MVRAEKVLGLKLNVHSLLAASLSEMAHPALVSPGVSVALWIHIDSYGPVIQTRSSF